MKVTIKLFPVMMDAGYAWDARGSSLNTPEAKDIADGLAYMVSVPDVEVHSIYSSRIWIPIKAILVNAV